MRYLVLDTSSDKEASAMYTSSAMPCNNWNKYYIMFIPIEFLPDGINAMHLPQRRNIMQLTVVYNKIPTGAKY